MQPPNIWRLEKPVRSVYNHAKNKVFPRIERTTHEALQGISYVTNAKDTARFALRHVRKIVPYYKKVEPYLPGGGDNKKKVNEFNLATKIIEKIVKLPNNYMGTIFKNVFAQTIVIEKSGSTDISGVVQSIAIAVKNSTGASFTLPFSRIDLIKAAGKWNTVNIPTGIKIKIQGATVKEWTLKDAMSFFLMLGFFYPFRNFEIPGSDVITDDSSTVTIQDYILDMWVLGICFVVSVLLGTAAPKIIPIILTGFSAFLGVSLNYKRRTDLKRQINRLEHGIVTEINENERLIRNIKFSRYAMN